MHRTGQKEHGQLPEHLEVLPLALAFLVPIHQFEGILWAYFGHILGSFPKVATIYAHPMAQPEHLEVPPLAFLVRIQQF